MELRSRTLRRAVAAAALGALLVPAGAGAAVKSPVITKVTPKHVSVGETLTIKGKNFRRGKGKNTLLFKRAGGKALFVKTGLATTKRITLVIPVTLEKFMALDAGKPTATRFRLRVLTTKLSKAFTSASASPVVGPAKPGATDPGPGSGSGGGVSAPACPTGGPNGDDDGDLLSNAQEQSIGTDPCNNDTDGDGVWDSFEYWSALDLNRGNAATSVPYPGKRPYPNPLDGTDAGTDHDGDSMTLAEEFAMWATYGNHSPIMNYSDGRQSTVVVTAPNAADIGTPALIWGSDPTLRFLDADHDGSISASELLALDFNRDGVVSASEFDYQDLNGNGRLSDDERDVDADGLTNFDEEHGRLTPGYWAGQYKDETAYTRFVSFNAPDYLTSDSDGDGIVDGLDDQDDDGFSNLAEMSRGAAQIVGSTYHSAYGQVNPFNPCLPARSDPFTDLNTGLLTTQVSPDCMRHPPFDGAPAPFDTSSPKYPNYLLTN